MVFIVSGLLLTVHHYNALREKLRRSEGMGREASAGRMCPSWVSHWPLGLARPWAVVNHAHPSASTTLRTCPCPQVYRYASGVNSSCKMGAAGRGQRQAADEKEPLPPPLPTVPAFSLLGLKGAVQRLIRPREAVPLIAVGGKSSPGLKSCARGHMANDEHYGAALSGNGVPYPQELHPGFVKLSRRKLEATANSQQRTASESHTDSPAEKVEKNPCLTRERDTVADCNDQQRTASEFQLNISAEKIEKNPCPTGDREIIAGSIDQQRTASESHLNSSAQKVEKNPCLTGERETLADCNDQQRTASESQLNISAEKVEKKSCPTGGREIIAACNGQQRTASDSHTDSRVEKVEKNPCPIGDCEIIAACNGQQRTAIESHTDSPVEKVEKNPCPIRDREIIAACNGQQRTAFESHTDSPVEKVEKNPCPIRDREIIAACNCQQRTASDSHTDSRVEKVEKNPCPIGDREIIAACNGQQRTAFESHTDSPVEKVEKNPCPIGDREIIAACTGQQRTATESHTDSPVEKVEKNPCPIGDHEIIAACNGQQRTASDSHTKSPVDKVEKNPCPIRDREIIAACNGQQRTAIESHTDSPVEKVEKNPCPIRDREIIAACNGQQRTAFESHTDSPVEKEEKNSCSVADCEKRPPSLNTQEIASSGCPGQQSSAQADKETVLHKLFEEDVLSCSESDQTIGVGIKVPESIGQEKVDVALLKHVQEPCSLTEDPAFFSGKLEQTKLRIKIRNGDVMVLDSATGLTLSRLSEEVSTLVSSESPNSQACDRDKHPDLTDNSVQVAPPEVFVENIIVLNFIRRLFGKLDWKLANVCVISPTWPVHREISASICERARRLSLEPGLKKVFDLLKDERSLKMYFKQIKVGEGAVVGDIAETQRTKRVAETQRTKQVAETQRTKRVAETQRTKQVAETQKTKQVAETQRTKQVAKAIKNIDMQSDLGEVSHGIVQEVAAAGFDKELCKTDMRAACLMNPNARFAVSRFVGDRACRQSANRARTFPERPLVPYTRHRQDNRHEFRESNVDSITACLTVAAFGRDIGDAQNDQICLFSAPDLASFMVESITCDRKGAEANSVLSTSKRTLNTRETKRCSLDALRLPGEGFAWEATVDGRNSCHRGSTSERVWWRKVRPGFTDTEAFFMSSVHRKCLLTPWLFQYQTLPPSCYSPLQRIQFQGDHTAILPFHKGLAQRMVKNHHQELHNDDATSTHTTNSPSSPTLPVTSRLPAFPSFTINGEEAPHTHPHNLFARHPTDCCGGCWKCGGASGGGGGERLGAGSACCEGIRMLLPLRTSLPDGTEVVVDLLNDQQQVTEVVSMIQDAASRDEGYVMEDVTSEKDFINEIHRGNGQVFRVAAEPNQQTVAAFVILDSNLYRGQRTVADSYLIVRPGQRRRGVGEWGLKMTLLLAHRMGYEAMYGDTFTDNAAMCRIFETCGFQRVGTLPMSGRGLDGRHKSSVLYFRQLDNLDSLQLQLARTTLTCAATSASASSSSSTSSSSSSSSKASSPVRAEGGLLLLAADGGGGGSDGVVEPGGAGRKCPAEGEGGDNDGLRVK